MAVIAVQCPKCGSRKVVKYGQQPNEEKTRNGILSTLRIRGELGSAVALDDIQYGVRNRTAGEHEIVVAAV